MKEKGGKKKKKMQQPREKRDERPSWRVFTTQFSGMFVLCICLRFFPYIHSNVAQLIHTRVINPTESPQKFYSGKFYARVRKFATFLREEIQ